MNDDQKTFERKRRAQLQRDADEATADLIRRGFITIVRIRPDGSRIIKETPGADQWWWAAASYRKARDEGALTEAHRKKVLAAFAAIKDRVELSDGEQELVAEVMGFQ